ncbi:TetR/AcrR family transcriptional regulator [Bifidobacterium avesanii]|uniref:TetR family transcriptional regulator n=1 Tax=Bifidobacterium avesanii TaxID=1798157 RepID=A0A7K3TEZ8_9BIFI|nr:TetR family transcriptional regulator [Bifidobacterium avesanii]KAB8295662.1 TetR family transcriptional regulator [Bifidobacterium avesanii]NEG77667.1 TetR family transcriptional regulator [Bifidobacterium avesanii]
MTEERTAEAPTRRYDPERKQRIIEACLDVIAERGVAGTSHRVVAAAAGVPLGSMTYHFDGMGDLLHQAFDQFARTSAAHFAKRMRAAGSVEEAREAIAAHVEEDLLATQRDFNITLELYTLAARDPAYRDITELWMTASRAELKRFFDPETSRMLDALIEGLTLHRAFGGDVATDGARGVREAIRRISDARPR